MQPESGPTPPEGTAGEDGQDQVGPLRWSIRRAIDLLDEGIDRMGQQLARSAGLWDDSPAEMKLPSDLPEKPLRGRRDPVDGHSPPMEYEANNLPGGPEMP
ncbi:hypothetical protein JOF29_006039 [Kribbella aluminosa]|uniref:Uncharacterized protein n=1 Tax=Kribbella aluminosa TaxID=416017 RepID=A0ABS4UTF7_9ACTN|nr:hypothetical protein [Kribbella aluminosa]